MDKTIILYNSFLQLILKEHTDKLKQFKAIKNFKENVLTTFNSLLFLEMDEPTTSTTIFPLTSTTTSGEVYLNNKYYVYSSTSITERSIIEMAKCLFI